MALFVGHKATSLIELDHFKVDEACVRLGWLLLTSYSLGSFQRGKKICFKPHFNFGLLGLGVLSLRKECLAMFTLLHLRPNLSHLLLALRLAQPSAKVDDEAVFQQNSHNLELLVTKQSE